MLLLPHPQSVIRSVLTRKVLKFVLMAGAVVSCSGKPETSRTQYAVDTLGRQIIGEGQEYQADTSDPLLLATKLNSSMQERRRFAWEVVAKVIKPVDVPNLNQDLPLWQTWYAPGEMEHIFRFAYEALTPAERDALQHGFTDEQISTALQKAASTRTGVNDSEFVDLLNKINTDEHKAAKGSAGAGSNNRRNGFPGLSPSFVRHFLSNYKDLRDCEEADASVDLMNQTSFSPCMKEFPRDTVMIKTSWEKVQDGMEDFDFSPESWAEAFTNLTNPKMQKVSTPSSDKIFRIKTRDGEEWALRAIHIVTKEVREWVWISLSWSGTPDLDLGSDRPATIPAPWNNYKMTVSTSFEELDPKPYMSAQGQEIATLRRSMKSNSSNCNRASN